MNMPSSRMNVPSSLERSISPPPPNTARRARKHNVPVDAKHHKHGSLEGRSRISQLAAVEAGKATVGDHLTYFSHHLSHVVKAAENQANPRLSIARYTDLYQRNSHAHGHHFVIHEHNHPIAGCHYDLRLQFSETSSCSFAVPYGLPGNPNSHRQGRMAIETRVHTLWNNLIESASHETGSLLIWDTGEYEVLPRKMSSHKTTSTDDEVSDIEYPGTTEDQKLHFDNEKLVEAFRTRYIRLRLHGTRLPKDYTITMRLPSTNDVVKHARPLRRGKRKLSKSAREGGSSDSGDDINDAVVNDEVGLASEVDEADEATTIRTNNAYTGAENTIGSVHQRHWFMALDKVNSGFVRDGQKWAPKSQDHGFEPFFVRGADVETSVITGRTSAEVMADEGVEGFVARKRWRPVLE